MHLGVPASQIDAVNMTFAYNLTHDKCEILAIEEITNDIADGMTNYFNMYGTTHRKAK
jgi:hypothetical protein